MINRLPSWFKQDIPDNKAFEIAQLLSELKVNTVCREAKCPNTTRCFINKQITFLILGNRCTRNCRFCNISGVVLNSKQNSSHKGDSLRLSQEPSLIRRVVEMLGLQYVVITSVSRDDLPDGGAGMFAKTIELIRIVPNGVKVEVLIPDFRGKVSSLQCVLDAGPDIVAHNIETVKRLYSDLRPEADYQLSLCVLRRIKELKPAVFTKSSIMLGMGETEEEVRCAMGDLRCAECDILTLGQYLAPSPRHYPVKEFVSIEQFEKYRQLALDLGFKAVSSGPLVRSSYKAEELYQVCNANFASYKPVMREGKLCMT